MPDRGIHAVGIRALGLGTLLAGLALPPGVALAAAPQGAVEVVTAEGYVKGWAYAPNVPGSSAEVRFYLDGPNGAYLGKVQANGPSATATARGLTGNRGFSFQLPVMDRDGRAHTVYAVAADPASEEATLEMTTACTLSHGAGAEARAGSVDDAYSWSCWRKAGDTNLGGPDLDALCTQKGAGYKPFLNGPQKATQAAYKWVCRKPAQDHSLDMTAACVARHGSGTQARADNGDDAYTWGCWKVNTTPDTKLGDPDLDGYCAQKIGQGYRPFLDGPQKATQAAYKWRCRKPGSADRSLEMATACTMRHGAMAQARARDINDAYTWGCWRAGVSAGAKVGSPDLEAACRQKDTNAKPFLNGPQKGPGAASKWLCRVSNPDTALEMATACTLRHGAGAQARAGDVNDAYTWACWRTSTTATKVGGPDLDGYCTQKVGSGYKPYIDGPSTAPQAASKWRCRKPRASPSTASIGSKPYTLAPPATQSEQVAYISMHADPTTGARARGNFHPWPGRKVALQTRLVNGHPDSAAAADNNPAVIAKILSVLDAAYDWYQDTTGRTPTPENLYQGRLTFTVIEPNCGAACGRLGATGIELSQDVYRRLYASVRDSLNDPKLKRPAFDQAVFYELGRNFWFYFPESGYRDTIKGADGKDTGNSGGIITGYAVLMRFASMEAAGVDGSDFGSMKFPELRKQVGELVKEYMADPNLKWSNTLALDKGVPNRFGSADLFASFVMRLAGAHSDRAFLKQLWRNVDAQKDATDTQSAVENFVVAASLAADTNLAPVFLKWRWPALRAPALAKIQGLKAPDFSKYGL